MTSQYTDWENVTHVIRNQEMISEAVGDYFFICPTNLFAHTFASHGLKVYYYYFTQVSSLFFLNFHFAVPLLLKYF